MDPSALIFIALALAWAGYLIPKALEHHEEGVRSRSIDRFSKGLRILARREPRGRRRTELVTVTAASEPAAPAAHLPATVLVPVVLTPALLRARRRAHNLAARRRRRVLDLLLLAVVVVAALAILAIVTWPWLALPGGLLVLWLVVCRLTVRRERRPLMERRPLEPVADPVDPALAATAASFDREDVTEEIARIVDTPADAPLALPAAGPATSAALPVVAGWDLQPVVVPTYVAKEQARRSVRTIDLDSTGVWSSGRSAADSKLVRDQAPASSSSAVAEPPTAAASGE